MDTRLAAWLIAGLCGSAAHAANIYILSSGDANLDAATLASLQAHGHTGTIGVPYSSFDGTQSLAGYQAVYFQANVNWAGTDMPAPGQNLLASFLSAGGGLVTCEWVIWKVGAQLELQTLAPPPARRADQIGRASCRE